MHLENATRLYSVSDIHTSTIWRSPTIHPTASTAISRLGNSPSTMMVLARVQSTLDLNRTPQRVRLFPRYPSARPTSKTESETTRCVFDRCDYELLLIQPWCRALSTPVLGTPIDKPWKRLLLRWKLAAHTHSHSPRVRLLPPPWFRPWDQMRTSLVWMTCTAGHSGIWEVLLLRFKRPRRPLSISIPPTTMPFWQRSSQILRYVCMPSSTNWLFISGARSLFG